MNVQMCATLPNRHFIKNIYKLLNFYNVAKLSIFQYLVTTKFLQRYETDIFRNIMTEFLPRCQTDNFVSNAANFLQRCQADKFLQYCQTVILSRDI